MTYELEYVAGLVASDGHMSKDSGVAIYSKNRAFAKHIKSLIEKISRKNVHIYKGKGSLKILVFDKELVEKLEKKFRICTGKKCNVLKFPVSLSKSEKINFLKGYVDGDGSLYIDKRKRYGNVYKYVRIEIASQTKEFLEEMRIFLQKLNINCGEVTEGKRVFRFRIYSKNAVIFLRKVGFSHPDKIFSFPKPQAVEKF